MHLLFLIQPPEINRAPYPSIPSTRASRYRRRNTPNKEKPSRSVGQVAHTQQESGKQGYLGGISWPESGKEICEVAAKQREREGGRQMGGPRKVDGETQRASEAKVPSFAYLGRVGGSSGLEGVFERAGGRVVPIPLAQRAPLVWIGGADAFACHQAGVVRVGQGRRGRSGGRGARG